MTADITSINQGNVDPCEQVNWRGDQVSVPQGSQSVFDSASVKLADLGSRKVVGDRVYRYALAAGTIPAGDAVEADLTLQYDVAATAGAIAPIGAKSVSVFCITATIAKNAFADGYLFVESGTAAGMGISYKVKSNSAATTGGTSTVVLYDPIKVAIPVADKIGVQTNIYSKCVQCTTGLAHNVVGVTPVVVASGEYFWLQTYGPCAAKGGTLTKAGPIHAAATGAVAVDVTSTAAEYQPVIGEALMACTASHGGLIFLKIAP
jgi:hypothetical protein